MHILLQTAVVVISFAGVAHAMDVADDSRLEQIIVTAQKRAERIQDVPVPVTVISPEALIDSNQLQLVDYYTRVPGLDVVVNDFRGTPALAIRGITTGGETNPTVGVMVDDVPYGSSTNIGGGTLVSEMDPNDLARIEVLRGPQGTLYGVSSMGGLLKYVTVEPSTDALTGRIQSGGDAVDHGDGAGYSLRGSVNVPLGSTLAVRASAFVRHEPGYIDDPALRATGVNFGDADGGRFAWLWRPSDEFSLKLGALLQHIEFHGASDVNRLPGLQELQQISLLPNTGGYSRNNQIFTANLRTALSDIEVTSITAYTLNRYAHSYDASAFYGTLQEQFFGVPAVRYAENDRTNSLSQELRISTLAGKQLDWWAGAFFTREATRYVENNVALNPDLPSGGISVVATDFPTTYEEYAVFGDLTAHVTDLIDVQFGGRESHNQQSFSQEYVGPFVPILFQGSSPYITPAVRSGDESFTYLCAPRLRLSPDFIAYMRLASGYRAGGPNTGKPAQGLPAAYKPDRTQNYELGFKGEILERALSIDASLYYIDWRDIQLSFFQGGFTYNANGSRAKSQGVEFSTQYQTLRGLSITGWATLSDAELTAPLPSGSVIAAAPGDRLPFSSRASGRIGVGQTVSVTDRVSAFLDSSVSYLSRFASVFATVGSSQRQTFPGYAKLDLRMGLQANPWTFNVYVNNLSDRRAPIAGGLGTTVPTTFFYIQPRNVGMSLTRMF